MGVFVLLFVCFGVSMVFHKARPFLFNLTRKEQTKNDTRRNSNRHASTNDDDSASGTDRRIAGTRSPTDGQAENVTLLLCR